MENCPNCGKKIKDSFLISNHLLNDETTELINTFTDKNETNYCSDCGGPLRRTAKKNYRRMKEELNNALDDYTNEFPIVTIENPSGWKYEIIGLVSETREVFVKYKELGEKKSLKGVRYKTFLLNGNAIIGARLNYSAITSKLEGTTYTDTIVISISGTAIKILNEEILSEKHKESRAIFRGFQETEALLDRFEI